MMQAISPSSLSEKAFRWLFVGSMAMIALNLETILHIEKANPLIKGVLILSGVLGLVRGRVDPVKLVLVFLAVFATFVSAMATDYPQFSWGLYFRSLISLMVFFIFLATTPNARDRMVVLLTLALMPPAMVLIGCVYQVMGLRPVMLFDSQLGAWRLQGSTLPAYMAGTAAAGAAAAMLLADTRNRRFMMLVVVNMLILLLTAGRMAALVGVVCCASIFFTRFRNSPRFKYGMVGLGLIGGALVAVTLASALIARASSGAMKGRDVIKTYLERFLQDYGDFGVGLGGQGTLVNREILVKIGTFAAHNEFLRLSVEIGRVSMLVVFACMVLIMLRTWLDKNIKRDLSYLLFSVMFLLFCTTDNALGRPEVFMIIVVGTYGLGAGVTKAARKAPPARSRFEARALPATK